MTTRPARPAPQEEAPSVATARGSHQHPTEEPVNQYTQDALFPESAVQTSGWAQPEPRDDETAEHDTVAEAA